VVVRKTGVAFDEERGEVLLLRGEVLNQLRNTTYATSLASAAVRSSPAPSPVASGPASVVVTDAPR